MSRRVTITFDAIDPPTIADFWAAALGYATNDSYGADQTDIAVAEDPDGPGPRLLFLRVPEAKATKNRVHLDVHCGIDRTGASLEDHQAAIATVVAELTSLGAVEGPHFVEVTPWTVMTDPEGNEFCVV